MSEYAFYDGKNPPKRVPVLPGSARDLETGDWVMGLNQDRPGIKKARKRAGYYEIRNTRKPAFDKGREKLVRHLEMLGNEPAYTWTVERVGTDELIAGIDEEEIKFAKRSLKQLRTFRKKGDAMSLKDVKDNMDLVNRIMIKLVLDRYGED